MTFDRDFSRPGISKHIATLDLNILFPLCVRKFDIDSLKMHLGIIWAAAAAVVVGMVWGEFLDVTVNESRKLFSSGSLMISQFDLLCIYTNQIPDSLL